MPDQWYIEQNGQPFGPLRFDQLKEELSKRPNWRSRLVWLSGSEDWIEAGMVPELAEIPPPLPTSRTSPWNIHSQQSSSQGPLQERPAPTQPKERGKLVSGIIWLAGTAAVVVATVMGGVIGREGYRFLTRPSQAQINDQLSKTNAEVVAKEKLNLPKKLDDLVTMVDIASNGVMITYFYAIDDENYKISSSFAELQRKNVVEKICQSTMVNTMKIGGRYEYVYRAKSSNIHLTTFQVGSDDCK